MFHSTSHQMMRKLDTSSPYRVQLKTSAGGYDMTKIEKNFTHEIAAGDIEQKKFEAHKEIMAQKSELKNKRMEERIRQLQAHKQHVEIVKEDHGNHIAAEEEHKESTAAATEKKRSAEDAKRVLDDHLRKLANFKQTANDVQPTRKQNPSTANPSQNSSRRNTMDVNTYVYQVVAGGFPKDYP
jgi:hypothetical protein